jgi:Rieske Fe-S protein
MSASADVLALASAEFEIGGIAEGTTLTVKWRGKPVFIRHRTADEVAREVAVSLSDLKDPQSDVDRASDPEWLVLPNYFLFLCIYFIRHRKFLSFDGIPTGFPPLFVPLLLRLFFCFIA